MSASSKAAALRSLRRVQWAIGELLSFRKKYKPAPGSVEMGHLIGLQDGDTYVKNEISRVTRLKVSR